MLTSVNKNRKGAEAGFVVKGAEVTLPCTYMESDRGGSGATQTSPCKKTYVQNMALRLSSHLGLH